MAGAGNLVVAVLGLGEAGFVFARDLAGAGVRVRGWDPAVEHRSGLGSVILASGDVDAVQGTDAVLSINSAAASLEVAAGIAPAMQPGQIFADLNTASPERKAEVARVVEEAGGLFADVALMSPVPRSGLMTPCLVSGSGAAAYAELLEPFGVPASFVDGLPGSAARRKLLRSVFMKGMAATIIESLEAAAAAGCFEWMSDEIAGVLEEADESLFRRLVEGSHLHAGRRMQEMSDAASVLRDLGIEPRITEATAGWLSQLAHNPRNRT